LLATGVSNRLQRPIECLTLAELFWQSIQESEGIEAVVDLKVNHGFYAAEKQVNRCGESLDPSDLQQPPVWEADPSRLRRKMIELPNRQRRSWAADKILLTSRPPTGG
jgi:hypothetical protein